MKRQGFTMVEMLVATALTLFLMVLISEAFVTALDTFSGLKSIGDMEEGLRTATSMLRSDLRGNDTVPVYHFEGMRKLSDRDIQTSPPQQGFFCIRQAFPPYIEGWDSAFSPTNNLPSYFANGGAPGWPVSGGNHTLHFTIRLTGNQTNSFLSATVPGGSPLLVPFATNSQPPDSMYQPLAGSLYNSSWAEVAYFLLPQGTGTGGMPLFGLYRSQFVICPITSNVTNTIPIAQFSQYQNMCCNINGANLAFYSPTDLASAPAYTPVGANNYQLTFQRAFDPTFNSGSTYFSQLTGNNGAPALLLNNVVSFNVRIFRNNNGTPQPQAPGTDHLDATGSTALANQFNTPGPYPRPSFDTCPDPDNGTGGIQRVLTGSGGVPVAITTSFPVSALEISIRVWDQKSQITRQITILQDM
jgi:prepilin-type N-terminal cleavage/methylation domain-containing protein